ncbi:MAG: cobaltochelatase subunit CobN [Bacteroidetes bacterium]|nr:cobaltochelatase subunit CobN [Bacteroidota bacterium]
MKKKKYLYFGLIIFLAVLLGIGYSCFMSKTKIATLNFPSFTVEKFIRSNNNPFVTIESVGLDEVEKISDYDMVLVRIHGSSLTNVHFQAIKKAIEKGVSVFSTESDNAKINSLKGRELEYVSTLMDNGSVKNYGSLFNYVRKCIDKKSFFNGEYAEPMIIPDDYFFHIGDDNFFATYEEYQSYYEKSGNYKKDAPRVILLSGNINMQNSNEEHMVAIINSLEKRGLNVYPINSFGAKKLKMISDVKPDLIINRPHGRLLMGGGERGTSLLKRLNVPILAPITVSDLHDKWLVDKQGMSSGGMTSMSVVMPELDGAIAPFAIAAQFERNGMRIFDAIPKHTEKFCSMAEKFTKLQTKNNRDKKVAIYYFKGVGKGAVSAAGIEGVESLFNTLQMLKANGYNLSGLPSDIEVFKSMIQKQGSVLGTYALGAYDEFLKNGNPALVDVTTFKSWSEDILPQKLIEDMKSQYGEAPGDYMGVEKEGKSYIAVAQITFGNVAILPQPLPSVGDDIMKLVHGVKGAPAYPYVASYLWTRNQFKADALVHFGTHGSLEFIPGKQIALSDYDWSDALVGDMPHFYIYTISNIGEGIIAKRRTYATLISHLTAPFMQSELYDDLKILENRIHKMEQMEESSIKQNYRESITKLSKSQNILSALSLDSTKTLNDKDIHKIHMYLEEIDASKVIDGLYTLGNVYSKENLFNTTRLMSIDAIRYSLAYIDVAHGIISIDKLEDLTFMAKRYNAKTERIIKRALRGESSKKLLKSIISKKDLQLLTSIEIQEREAMMRMGKMMRQMGVKREKKTPIFLDSKGVIVEAEKVVKKKEKTAPSMMQKMAQAKSMGAEEQGKSQNEELVSALKSVKEAVMGITAIKENLRKSTKQEQLSLLNALNGGYISPSSAGDPIVNPHAVPTGRNFYSINPETTPSAEAWKVGKRLAENLLEAELSAKGKYPEKVSFTLWSSNFISSEGATIAQVLYLLGVEPLRDGFGYIRSLRLIPIEKLGRPRIDVIVQTSGQLRDIASSRLKLINDAVKMAAKDKSENNYVRKGFEDAERRLLEKGFSPIDARKYSKERVFGGVKGNYGTGIMGMVEKGDSWDSRSQIAKQYIKNMGAMYSANGGEDWGEMREGVFEAALLNASVVVQPRSSNTWGALSLDHVYEFMGGISSAIEEVTGNDPTAYFNDFRNSSRAKVQGLKEAIGVETNSTVFNPKYIAEMMKGEASSMSHFAETFRNTYGWNAMKPSAIDQHIWNKYYDIYVKDEYKLGLEKTFAQKNPYALQEMTAVMLESARKGMWQATDAQLKDVAKLHTKFVAEYSAGCSGFICDNPKLRKYISSKVDKASSETYNKSIDVARQVQLNESQQKNNVVLKKDKKSQKQKRKNVEIKESKSYKIFYIIGGLLVLMFAWILVRSKRTK